MAANTLNRERGPKVAPPARRYQEGTEVVVTTDRSRKGRRAAVPRELEASFGSLLDDGPAERVDWSKADEVREFVRFLTSDLEALMRSLLACPERPTVAGLA
jgi:hypothetical protein